MDRPLIGHCAAPPRLVARGRRWPYLLLRTLLFTILLQILSDGLPALAHLP